VEHLTGREEKSPAEDPGGEVEGAGDPGGEPGGAGADPARVWRLAAYALLAAAAALLSLRLREAAFFAAALGVSAWFLNVRAGLKRKHDLVKDGPRNWRPRRELRDPEGDAGDTEE